MLKEKTKEDLFFKFSHKIKPVEGTIIMFPADLIHSVSQNDDDEDRISIAFNLSVIPK